MPHPPWTQLPSDLWVRILASTAPAYMTAMDVFEQDAWLGHYQLLASVMATCRCLRDVATRDDSQVWRTLLLVPSYQDSEGRALSASRQRQLYSFLQRHSHRAVDVLVAGGVEASVVQSVVSRASGMLTLSVHGITTPEELDELTFAVAGAAAEPYELRIFECVGAPALPSAVWELHLDLDAAPELSQWGYFAQGYQGSVMEVQAALRSFAHFHSLRHLELELTPEWQLTAACSARIARQFPFLRTLQLELHTFVQHEALPLAALCTRGCTVTLSVLAALDRLSAPTRNLTDLLEQLASLTLQELNIEAKCLTRQQQRLLAGCTALQRLRVALDAPYCLQALAPAPQCPQVSVHDRAVQPLPW